MSIDLSTRPDWRYRPGWSLFTSREEFGGEGPLLSLSASNGVRERIEGDGRAASEDLSGYRVVRPGDIVINRLVARDGAIAVSGMSGIISPAYWVLKTSSCSDPRYFGYVLNSTPYLAEIGARSKFMPPAQFDLPWDEFRTLPIPCPGLQTQRAIADYLDTETVRIDALIEKKRHLTRLMRERLLERERGLVSAAVGSARLPVASLFRISKGIDAQRLTTEYCQEHQGEYPVYSGQTSGAFGFIDTFDFSAPSGAIVVSTVGARVMSQTTVSGKFSLSQNCLVLIPHRPSEMVVKSFVPQLRQLFDELRSRIPDHMQPSLRVEDLKGKWLLVPSRSEQVRLAAEISRVGYESDEICQRLERQIELLMEHRQALITSAVTGELEVPGVAA